MPKRHAGLHAFVRQILLVPKGGSYKTLDWGDGRERLSRHGQTQLGLDSVLVGCEYGILHKIGVPELPHAFP